MSANPVNLEISSDLFARLQALAAEERTDPARVIEKLAAAEMPAIVRDPKLRGGRPVIAGTGTTVRTVAGLYKLGLSAEDITGELPLTLAQVYAALAYYHGHIDEVEADIQADAEESLLRESETDANVRPNSSIS